MSDFEPKLHLVTAKKEHTCTECGRKIEKGTKCWRDDGDGWNSPIVKQHKNCLEHEPKLTAKPPEGV